MSVDTYMKNVESVGTRNVSMQDEKNLTSEQLVENNLKFVVKIAHSYKGMLSLEDLIQEGNIGLMKAAERFDTSRDIKFITYAVHYIKKYMRMAITRHNNMIKGSNGRSPVFSMNKQISDDGNATFEEIIMNEKCDSGPDEHLSEHDVSNYVSNMVDKLDDIERNVIRDRFGFNGRKKTLDEISKSIGYTIAGVSAIEKRAKKKLGNIINLDEC